MAKKRTKRLMLQCLLSRLAPTPVLPNFLPCCLLPLYLLQLFILSLALFACAPCLLWAALPSDHPSISGAIWQWRLQHPIPDCTAPTLPPPCASAPCNLAASAPRSLGTSARHTHQPTPKPHTRTKRKPKRTLEAAQRGTKQTNTTNRYTNKRERPLLAFASAKGACRRTGI